MKRTLHQIRYGKSSREPFGLSELAALAGFTPRKVQLDVEHGYLVAARPALGKTRPLRVEFIEGCRWLHQVGALPERRKRQRASAPPALRKLPARSLTSRRRASTLRDEARGVISPS